MGRQDHMTIMPTPVPASSFANGKVPTDARSMFVMFALPGFLVEPKTRPVQLIVGGRYVSGYIRDQFVAQVVGHREPVIGVIRTLRRVHERRIAHMHTTDAASLTGLDERKLFGSGHGSSVS